MAVQRVPTTVITTTSRGTTITPSIPTSLFAFFRALSTAVIFSSRVPIAFPLISGTSATPFSSTCVYNLRLEGHRYVNALLSVLLQVVHLLPSQHCHSQLLTLSLFSQQSTPAPFKVPEIESTTFLTSSALFVSNKAANPVSSSFVNFTFIGCPLAGSYRIIASFSCGRGMIRTSVRLLFLTHIGPPARFASMVRDLFEF